MPTEIRPVSIQDKYEVHGLIGSGGQANVYKGVEKLTEREVAIKVMKIEDVGSDLEREIELLVKMRSPFIISFIEALKYETEIWVVMEYCACGSMKDIYALQRRGLNEDQAKDVVSFAVLGLHHIHNLRCLHRDIKAANLLLSGDGVAKLADFGVSAELDEGASTRHSTVGSAHWMSPEMINGVGYDGSADIWSLGITIIELVEGNPPNIKLNPRRSVTMTVTNPAPKLKNSTAWSADMKDFVDRCLQKDPKHRATTRELLQHRWINQTVQTIVINRGSTLLQELYGTVNSLKIKLMEDYENSLLTPEQREAKARAKVAAEEARLKAIADAEETAKLKAIQEAEAEVARLKAIADEEEAARLRVIAEEEEAARLKALAEAEEAARLKAIAEAEAEAEAARLRAIREEEEAARLRAIQEAEEAERLKAIIEAEAEAARLRAIQVAEAEEAARLRVIAEEEEAAKLQALAEAEEAARLRAIAEAEEVARLKAIQEAEAEVARLKAIVEAKEAARKKAIEEAKEAARLKAVAEAEAEAARLRALSEAEEVTRLSSQMNEISELEAHLEHLDRELVQCIEERSRLKDLIESANERHLQSEAKHKTVSEHLEESQKIYDSKIETLNDLIAQQQILQHQLTEEEAAEIHTNKRKNSSTLNDLPIDDPTPPKFEGFLLKKGKSLGMWQRRTYTIENGVLMYISKEGVTKHRYPFSASTVFSHTKSNQNVPPCGIYLSDERAGWAVPLRCENEESKAQWVQIIQNHLSHVLSIVNSQETREKLMKQAEEQKIEEKKQEEYHEHVLINLRKKLQDSEIRRVYLDDEIAQLFSDLESSSQELHTSETNMAQSKILFSQLTQSYEKVQFDCERLPQEITKQKQIIEETLQTHQKVNETARIERESIVVKEITLDDIQINEDLVLIDDGPTASSSSYSTRHLSVDDSQLLSRLPERKLVLRVSQSEMSTSIDDSAAEDSLDFLPPTTPKLQTSQSDIQHLSLNRQKKGISSEFKSLMADRLSQKRELMRLKLFANEAVLMINKMEEKVRNIVEEQENLEKSSLPSANEIPFQQQPSESVDNNNEKKSETQVNSNQTEETPAAVVEAVVDVSVGDVGSVVEETVNSMEEKVAEKASEPVENMEGETKVEESSKSENPLMISQQSEDDGDDIYIEEDEEDDEENHLEDHQQDQNEDQQQPQPQQQQRKSKVANPATESLLLEQEVEKISQLKVEIERAALLIENIEKSSISTTGAGVDNDSTNSQYEPVPTTDSRPISIQSNRSADRLSMKQDHEIYEARMTKIAQDEADKWEIATYETLDALRLPSISSGTTAVVNGQLRQSVDLRSPSLLAASLTGPLRHVGWLYKQSEYLQSWNKRYFVLENCVLSYYYNTHSLGHVYELTAQTKLATTIPSQPLCMKIDDSTGNWSLLIKCENETSKQEWVWRLQEHIRYITHPPANLPSAGLEILEEGENEEEDEARRTLGESSLSTPPPLPSPAHLSPKKKRSIPSFPSSDISTLTEFATLKGWGSKQGTYFWNPRYFILSNATLTYYASDSPADLETPRGTYIFTQSTSLITQSNDSSLPSHCLTIQDVPGEWSLTIKFENDEIVEQWHRSIALHIMFMKQ